MRDRQRVWCPRCQGRLLAPAAPPVAAASSRPPAHPPTQQGTVRLPTGFRWIAVRPGPPPPAPRRRRPLGPTPRYRSIPRWGLRDPITPVAATVPRSAAGASEIAVRATLLASAAVFALGAAAHGLRYLLLLINRGTLLPPLVADGALLMGILVSLAAIAATIATAAVTTSWLIARRAKAFRLLGQDDPRPEWMLWAGCLTPLVNVLWAPVFVIELAHAEQCHGRLRGRITAWWISWVFSIAVSGWATWTSGATDPQGVADNTVTEVVAYLAGLVAVLLLLRVVDGFVHRPVQQRPTHRWVVVGAGDDPAQAGARVDPAQDATRSENPGQVESVVESMDPEPAA